MTFLSSLSPSSSKTSSPGVSVVPAVVSSILSSMQAYQSPSTITTDEGQASGHAKSWEDGNQVDHSLRRTKSREEKSAVAKPIRLSSRPKTSAGGGSRSASRRFVTSTRAGSPPGSTSIKDQPHQLSPSASRFSYETSSSTSSKRLVGRGGSGSKYRAVAPKPPTLNIDTLSKPGLLPDTRPPPPDAPIFHRPSGRGGIGARKKLSEEPPAVLSKIPLRKVLSTKFRKDSSSSGKSVRSVESIPEGSTSPQIRPSQRPYHERNASFWTYGTTSSGDIHHSPRSIPENEDVDENALDGYVPPLSPACSTFEDASGCATPASARKKGNIAKVAKMLGELPPHEIYESLYRQHRLMQDVPIQDASPDSRASVKMSRRSSIAAGIYSLFSSARSPGSTASQCTLSTAPDGLHPGIFADDVSDSWGRNSGDITRDLDDLDGQISVRCKTPESPMMFSPPSPSLVPTRTTERVGDTSDPTPADSTSQPISSTLMPTPVLEIETSTLGRVNSLSSSSSSPTTPVPTLLRSRSHYLAARRTIFRTSHSASVSFGVDSLNGNGGADPVTNDGHDRQLDESLASARFIGPLTADGHKRQSQILPELAHWLKPPNAPADAYDGNDVFSAYRIDGTAKSQAWSGEWNTDMQDVIRALRLLR